MRRLAPAIFFVLTIALYWAVNHDSGGIMEWLPPSAGPYAILAAGTAIWFAAAWLATSILVEIIRLVVRRRGGDRLPKILVDIGALLIFFCAGLAVVSRVFGYPLNGLLTTSGVLAAIIGLSLQKTIGNVSAGITLNAEQTIRLGDWIETSAGAIGKVIEITWRTTHLETIAGRVIVIPNGMLIDNSFTNFSAPQRYMRFNKRISIDYNQPAERIVRILEAALKASDGVLAEPPPMVFVGECADSGVAYDLYYWTADYPESFRITGNVLSTALKFLDQAGISPVYPKQDITLFEPATRHIERKYDVADILHRVPFFSVFAAESLQQIVRGGKLREFRPDEVVVFEEDTGKSLFVVIAGLLEVSKRLFGAEKRHLGRLMPGDLFGEMSLLTGASRSATVTASSHVTLLEIDKELIEPILTSHPESIASLSQFIVERNAANATALAKSSEEKQEIVSLGAAAFMRKKIAAFFGLDPD